VRGSVEVYMYCLVSSIRSVFWSHWLEYAVLHNFSFENWAPMSPGTKQRTHVILAHGLSGALFLNLKNQIKMFQKNQKNYMDRANNIHYHRVKLQYKISCILSSKNLIKKQIWEHEQCPFFFQNLSNSSFL
jgi:hypothetical protein